MEPRYVPSSSNVAKISRTLWSANRSLCAASKIAWTFGVGQPPMRCLADDLRNFRGSSFAQQRRAGCTQRTACTSYANLPSKSRHDVFDRSSSAALSLAIICKSACAFPSAATTRWDFSSLRRKRSISSRSRRASSASGFEGRPRLGGSGCTSCFRQLESSELYTPALRVIDARSSADVAAPYSARMRAFSVAVNVRRFDRGRTSGSVDIRGFLRRPHEFSHADGLAQYRHRGWPRAASLTSTSGLVTFPWPQIDGGTTTHWTVSDPMRTTFLQTNAAGAVYWQADYDPYGSVYALRTPDAHQPLRFAGQEAQELTGTAGANGDSRRFYNRYRWYRPKWGRYTQPDPLGSSADLLNLYAYARANPSSFVDPWGLFGGGLGFGAQGEANTLVGQGAFNASVGITLYYDQTTGEISAALNGAVGGFYSPDSSYNPAANNASGVGASGGLNLVGTNANSQDELDSVPDFGTHNSQGDLGVIAGGNYLLQYGPAENGQGRGIFSLSGCSGKSTWTS